MIIKRLELTNFGKFSGFTIDFSQGIQVVYGNNEDGKTTVMNFIRLMFYGDQGRSRQLERQPRQLYLPWNGGAMEGAITFETNNTQYHLQKIFAESSGRDVTSLINLSTGKEVPLEKGQEVGNYFFGLDYSGFERSSFIHQIGNIDSGTGSDEIAEKLLKNLVDSGDEGISSHQAIKNLEDAKHQLVTRSGKKGLLVEKREEINMLCEEKQYVIQLIKSQNVFQVEYDNVTALRKEQQELIGALNSQAEVNRVYRLQELSVLLRDYRGLVGQLSSPNFPYKAISSFVQEGKELLAAVEQAKNRKEALEQAVPTTGEEPQERLTQEELDTLYLAEKHAVLGSEIEKIWENKIIPTWKDYQEISRGYYVLLAKYNQQEEVVKSLQVEHIRFKESEEKKKQLLLKLEEAKERSSLDEKAKEAEKKPSVNIPLLALAVVIMVVSIVVVSKFLWIGIIAFLIGLVVLGLSLVNILVEPKKKEPKITRAVAEVGSLEKELEEVEERILACKARADNFIVLQEALNQLFLEVEQEKLIVKNVLDALYFYYGEISAGLEVIGLVGVFPTNIADMNNLDQYSLLLQERVDLLEKQKTELLLSRKVETIGEYQEKLLTEGSSQKAWEHVKQQNKSFAVSSEIFVSFAASYSPVDNFLTAQALLQSIEERYARSVALKQNIESMAIGMGLTDENLLTLEEEINNKVPLTEYSPEKTKEMEHRLEALNRRDFVAEMQELQRKIKLPKRNVEQINMEIRKVQEELSEIEQYYEALTIAYDNMLLAQSKLRESFNPSLNAETSRIFSELTGTNQESLVVSDSYDIKVQKGSQYKDWQYLSSGTIDQAYLSLRLAITSLISPPQGHIPVFLDDILIQYDDSRGERALVVLKEYSQKKSAQIILFTCHHRMLEFAKQNGVAFQAL